MFKQYFLLNSFMKLCSCTLLAFSKFYLYIFTFNLSLINTFFIFISLSTERKYPWGNKFDVNRMNIWQGKFPEKNSEKDGYKGVSPVDAFPSQNEFGESTSSEL